MARFNFRLTSVLRLREAARDERRGQLAEAYRAADILAARQAEVQDELRVSQTGEQQSARGRVDVDRLMESYRYRLLLEAELATLARQEALIAVEIDKRRQALVVADREVKVLEKLRERDSERFGQAQAALAMKQLDEAAAQGMARRESESAS